jgi:hypothetical protein
MAGHSECCCWVSYTPSVGPNPHCPSEAAYSVVCPRRNIQQPRSIALAGCSGASRYRWQSMRCSRFLLQVIFLWDPCLPTWAALNNIRQHSRLSSKIRHKIQQGDPLRLKLPSSGKIQRSCQDRLSPMIPAKIHAIPPNPPGCPQDSKSSGSVRRGKQIDASRSPRETEQPPPSLVARKIEPRTLPLDWRKA